MKIKVLYKSLRETDYTKAQILNLVATDNGYFKLREHADRVSVPIEPWIVEESPEHKKLLALTAAAGIELQQIGREIEYEDADLVSAEVVQLGFLPVLNDNYLFGGRKAGSLVLSGKRINAEPFKGPLDVDVKKLLDSEVQLSEIGDMFISARIKKVFEDRGFRGLHFWPCKDHKNRTKLNGEYFAVSFEDVIESKFIESPEIVSDGITPPVKVQRKALESFRDIAVIDDTFDSTLFYIFARPYVYEALRDAQVQDIEWVVPDLVD